MNDIYAPYVTKSSDESYDSQYSSDEYSYNSYSTYTTDESNDCYKTQRIIHQTWKSDDLSDIFCEWRDEWLKMCPDYKYKFYTDDDLRHTVEQHFPQYLTFYDSLKHNIERVDVWRYMILYIEGGVYSDLDVIPLKNIDKWMDMGKVVLGTEPYEHSYGLYGRKEVICNAFMISPKKDPFWMDLMDFIVETYKNNGPVHTTGPMAMTKFYEQYPEKCKDIVITDPSVFYPLTNGKTNKTQEYNGRTFYHVSNTCDIKDAYTVHLWSNTWCNKMEPIFESLCIYIPIGVLILLLIIFIILFALHANHKK